MSREPQKKATPPRDRHSLYEASVQCPEADIQFFERVYREWNEGSPTILREDFCGTAWLAATWVKSRADRKAIGIDLHGPTLRWGVRKHIKPLGEAAERVDLRQADVRASHRPKADVVAALNFSYFIFKKREELREYFAAVRRGLAPKGLFVLDIFGGWQGQALTTETKRRKGFTYVWQQASFDPISNHSIFYIHFRFPDGSVMRRAFTYDWRMWSVAEVREILKEAGFRRSEVYWEGTDRRTGRGNGVFRRARRAVSSPGWIAYIVAG